MIPPITNTAIELAGPDFKEAINSDKVFSRLSGLDYLRGFCAIGIMVYHYMFWSYGGCDSGTILGRVSIYGVSMFYVLSGLTLFHVYHERIVSNIGTIGDFIVKRVFRIFPLLWLATIGTLIFRRTITDPQVLILNFTGLFGFFRLDSYIGTGVWSIGNELVFYTFFPFFVILFKRFRSLFWLVGTLVASVYIYYCFVIITGESIVEKWIEFINPFNQLFLFWGGYFIGVMFSKREFNQKILGAALIFSVFGFCLFPVSGDIINLVHGFNRIIFTLFCFICCLAFYKLNFHFHGTVDFVLRKLGEITYSVYLIHPIAWSIVEKYVNPGNKELQILFSVSLTLSLSWYTYQYFEKYFIRLGKKLSGIILLR